MKARQLLDLRCPFCNTATMRLTHVIYWPDSREVRSGLLRCECDVFPVVEGIVVLRRNQQVVVQELLRAHQNHTSPDMMLILAQLSEFRLVMRRVFMVLVQVTIWFKKILPTSHASHALSWWKHGLTIMSLASTDSFSRAVFSYFRDRDRRPTYNLVTAVTPLVQTAQVVIEVGGGAGHFVRALSKQLPNTVLYSLEKNFWLVYWLTCNGLYRSNVCPIVMNFEGGLPFQNSMADVVMANDTIMYVHHQHRLATEMNRVMKRNGWCIGMHVHQFDQENTAQGNGIKPKDFLKWLGLPYWMTWSDRALFQQLWSRQKLAFKTNQNQKSVAPSEKSFSFIASRQQKTGTLALSSHYQQDQLHYVEDQW